MSADSECAPGVKHEAHSDKSLFFSDCGFGVAVIWGPHWEECATAAGSTCMGVRTVSEREMSAWLNLLIHAWLHSCKSNSTVCQHDFICQNNNPTWLSCWPISKTQLHDLSHSQCARPLEQQQAAPLTGNT